MQLSVRSITLSILIATCAALVISHPAEAQDSADWPTKPIKLVVPTSAGGGNDSVARHMAQFLSEQLGQPVLVENVPGAGNVTGTALVARADPDGYTLLNTGVSAITISPHVYPAVPYKPEDLKAISQVNASNQVLVVHPGNMPVENTADLIAALKADPGKYNYGSNGIGGIGHLAMELFQMRTGTEANHVPFRGGGDVVTALLGGHVDMAFNNVTSVLGQIQDGSVRPIAVAAAERDPQLPDVPTIAETVEGFPGFSSWIGVFAPAGTPDAIVARIQEGIATYAETEAAKEFARSSGSILVASTPGEFAEVVAADSARWKEVVDRIGLKLE